MRILLCLAATLFAMVAGPIAGAQDEPKMSFVMVHSDDGLLYGQGSKDYIYAEGEIAADTPATLRDFFSRNQPKDPHALVVLNSHGGDIAGALGLGRMIRNLHYWTAVGSQLPIDIGVSESVPRHLIPYLHQAVKPPFTGACLNACALVYLGGEYRFMDYGSQYRVDPSAAAGSDVANYISEMGVTGVGPGVRPPPMSDLIKWKVVTPRWVTASRIENLNGLSYLALYTTDPWGDQEIDWGCYTPPGGTPALVATFHLDPGARAKAGDLVTAVQKYVVQFEFGPITLDEDQTFDNQVLTKALVDPKGRLTATALLPLTVPQHHAAFVNVPEMMQSNPIGFMFVFDPKAGLPMRLLQFKSDFNGEQLKQFVAQNCH